MKIKTNGAGKYDDLCTQAREQADADACILILKNGNKGTGFSMQTTNDIDILALPHMLRLLAQQIEKATEFES